MKTLFKYTNKNMGGWEFVLLTDNGTDGHFVTGNTAATAISTGADLTVIVGTKKELRDIVTRLDWLGKYSNLGSK